MDIKITGHEFYYDITSMSMLFFPGEKTFYVKKSSKPVRIISKLYNKNGKYISQTKIFYYGKVFVSQKTLGADCDTRNLVKYTFYKVCSKATKIVSPWGILTGIRPLDVYMRHLYCGDDVQRTLKNEYLISENKIELLEKIYRVEKDIFVYNKKDVSVYISIPFCPSKCLYCSFISVSATNAKKLLSDYFEKLCIEIEIKAQLIKNNNLKIRSIYIGGGTPGILACEQLVKLLSTINSKLDLKDADEFCFEIGRPETLDEQKLDLLKTYGVTRLCINTQTTNDDILKLVNRTHDSKTYFNAIDIAKKYQFDSINTDLIAGLPEESYESFCKSVNDVIKAGVDNITIHTLAIKKSASLSEDKNNFKAVSSDVTDMLDYAYNLLLSNGYVPYYIYRQKNCISNGENIGFCKPEHICKYNVYMMEDVHSIIACGAGASSKIVDGKKVNRVVNVKYPMEYVREFEKIESNTVKLHNILKAKK